MTAGPRGGTLSTSDASGAAWCLAGSGAEGSWTGAACGANDNAAILEPLPSGSPPPAGGGAANFTLSGGGSASLGYNRQVYASGPWPHSRYVSNGAEAWTLDLAALQAPAGARVAAADTLGIIDDDLVGGVRAGGEFCLDLVAGGMLEVWAGPLSGGRWALALFNRSPASDTIAATWAMFNASGSFAVRDIWLAQDMGAHPTGYTAQVAARSTAYLVLTPA